MNTTKSVFYEINGVPSYVMEQLTSGLLTSFFPVSFVHNKEDCMGVYRTEQYVPLETLESLSVMVFLNIFCKLLSILSKNEKHYFSSDAYAINMKTVYVDLKRQEVRLIYVPNNTPCPVKIQLIQLLKDGKAKVGESGSGYLEDMICFLNRDEVGYYSAIHHGEQLLYEINICGVK